MKTYFFKNTIVRILLAFVFLAGGLAVGDAINANAYQSCAREACNDDDECEWYGNMTTCDDEKGESDGGSYDDGVC